MSLLLFAAEPPVGKSTAAGESKEEDENTGRSSAEPTLAPPMPGAAPPPFSLWYRRAIERMSIRPEPSCPPAWAMPAPPPPPPPPLGAADGADDEAEARGVSLASAARLLSENKTEFSLRSPRNLGSSAPSSSGAPMAPRPARQSMTV